MTFRFLAGPRSLAVPVVAAAALAATAGVAAAQPAASPGWRVIKTIPVKNTSLLALATIKGSPAWAGGYTPKSPEYVPAVYHLGGAYHRTVLSDTLGAAVTSVSATSATNVWASLSNLPVVEHLTGKGWVAHTFAIGTDQILLAGVVTTGPKDTFVFAYDFATKVSYAYHYNGKHWSRRLIPDGADANSDTGLVSGTSYSNIWALTAIGTGNTYASLRFNGRKWQVVKFPAHLAPAGTTVFARQILAESAKSVWATIYASSKTAAGPVVLLHWNGYRWSKVGGKLPKAALAGPMASDGSGGLWLSALNTAFTKPLLLHYSHDKWSTHRVPTDRKQLLSITALSLIPGTHSVLGLAEIGESPGGNFGSAVLKYGR